MRPLPQLHGGPAKQFLIAAQSAGVDLEDPSTPDAFVTGWNARHELD